MGSTRSDVRVPVHIAGVTAYEPSQWGDMFVATAGASAALTGLVFVAVSINIEQILKLAGLPERGVETLVLLLTVLLVSLTGLIPGQGRTALGVELLAVSVIAGTGLTSALEPERSADPEPPALAGRPLVDPTDSRHPVHDRRRQHPLCRWRRPSIGS